MYVEGDVPYSGGNNNNGAFGADGWWGGIIGLIAVAAIFGGFGNGGGIFGSRGNGGGSELVGYQLGGLATQADVAAGFNNSAVLSSLNDLKLGQAGLQQTLCQGFGGVNTALVQQGYETRLGVNALSAQIADCCCKTNNNITSGFADIKYAMAKDTCDVTNAINASTQQIIGFMTQQELAQLRNENQSLKFAASQTAQNAFIAANQEAQTSELIRRLGRDCPIPAYVVPNPNCCYGNPCGVGYNGNCCVGASVQ